MPSTDNVWSTRISAVRVDNEDVLAVMELADVVRWSGVSDERLDDEDVLVLRMCSKRVRASEPPQRRPFLRHLAAGSGILCQTWWA